MVQGTDLRGLPIGPVEGFILTRMDGALPIPVLAEMTGQSEEEVRSAVDKLVSLGAAEWVDGRPSEPSSDEAAFAEADTVPPPPAEEPAPGATPPAPGQDVPPSDDPAELDEDVDLPMERRRRVLDTFHSLGELDYYAVLGVPRDADKAAIRTAYFTLSKEFHPDTAYGRNLGSFKAKMERIFREITEAYETLGRKKKRQAYDEYLRLKDTTRAAEEAMQEATVQAQSIERGSTPAPPPASPPPAGPRPPSDAVRRQLFAQRLAAVTRRSSAGPPAGRPSIPPGAPSSVPPHIASPSEDRRAVLRGLAQSLQQASRHTGSGGGQLPRALEEARRAEAEGDLVEAANALRLAVALAPGDVEVQREHDRVHRRLAKGLAESFEKQARYEEQNEKWADAALSWVRVVEGRPDQPEPHRKAALALVRGGGDLRRARDLAQKAVDLEPSAAQNRAVLGQIYRAAGMKLNARRELEEAAKLDPKDEIVKNLLRELDK
ncbi:MAG: DnaJ domain-containing protein [Myxococcota bacterium]